MKLVDFRRIQALGAHYNEPYYNNPEWLYDFYKDYYGTDKYKGKRFDEIPRNIQYNVVRQLYEKVQRLFRLLVSTDNLLQELGLEINETYRSVIVEYVNILRLNLGEDYAKKKMLSFMKAHLGDEIAREKIAYFYEIFDKIDKLFEEK